MSENVAIVYKKPGQTPLEAIRELRESRPELANTPMTYAGRLDPLASGVLLILIGDECLKKDEYLALPKEYEVEVLFGFATDTYDVMGKVNFSPPYGGGDTLYSKRGGDSLINHHPLSGTLLIDNNHLLGPKGGDELTSILKKFTGKITQKYPPYSSRTVNGKPLYQWARDGKIDEVTIPSHDVFVESIDVLGMGEITGEKLLEQIKEDIGRVAGDFRQEEILKLWRETLHDKKDAKFQTAKLKIVCGSGVYVRSIANDLGITIGSGALALKIVRTKIGEYLC